MFALTVMLRTSPWRFLRAVPWGIIPLVGGLFVLVEALDRSGAIRVVSDYLKAEAQRCAPCSAAGAGVLVGVVSNLINNLPAGVIAGTAVQSANVAPEVSSAVLIGIDLGPNLSVTGSLATILWLTALRRDGVHIKARDFLKLGLVVMPPALVLALAALLLAGG
ncbi:MAG TPA: ArsB/NhaD family transporter [Steroidobacteraceae bacterium]|nr:ArsB/NhaD family transporter [Steroidobacteraceae bacterium]